MYELVRQIWQEERIPEEWKEIILVPVHKKGDRDRCENYRGIAYKILSNIKMGKIKPCIGKVIGDYQNGFGDGRSVIFNIFTLKIINEKLWEYNQSIYLLIFKRHMTLHRYALWKCMKEFIIPAKLINMCKTCTKDKKCSWNRRNIVNLF